MTYEPRVYEFRVICGHCGNTKPVALPDDATSEQAVAVRYELKRRCYCARCEEKGLERRVIIEPRWTNPLAPAPPNRELVTNAFPTLPE